MTEYYTVAKKQSQCYGHGDYREEVVIAKTNWCGVEGEFPPIFKTEALANEYRDNIKWNSDYVVVSLHLSGEGDE